MVFHRHCSHYLKSLLWEMALIYARPDSNFSEPDLHRFDPWLQWVTFGFDLLKDLLKMLHTKCALQDPLILTEIDLTNIVWHGQVITPILKYGVWLLMHALTFGFDLLKDFSKMLHMSKCALKDPLIIIEITLTSLVWHGQVITSLLKCGVWLLMHALTFGIYWRTFRKCFTDLNVPSRIHL